MGWLRDTFGRLGGGVAAVQRGDAALHLQRGAGLLAEGRFAAAAEALERARALARPEDGVALHEVHYLLGRAQAALGLLAPASLSFEAAVAAKPDFADALAEGAGVLQELESHQEAVEWLQRLVRLRPDPAARLQLAQELRKCGRDAEAVDLLRPLCVQEPRNIDAALLHHHALVSLGRLDAGLAEIDRVLRLCEPHADLLVNRAVPLARLGRHEEAMKSIAQALKLDPAHRRALANRVSVLVSQLRLPEAIAAAEQGLRMHPQDADLHWRLGAALLLAGDWDRGWRESEWRTQAQGYESTAPGLDRHRWQGEDLAGRTIFLYPEQGFGDAIQFLRFVPELARRAKTVLVLVWPELEPLVAGALPANCKIVTRGSTLPAFDVHCPLMSLPALFGTKPDGLPGDVPYLRASPADVQAWRQRLGTGALNVGLCWAGNPRHFNDRDRSVSLATLRGVAVEGCRFFTLQPQKRPGDEEALAAWPEAVDTGPNLRNYADTAALIEALDLVVTVDTSVAHLAGALGKPVWILLAHSPDWRWMLDRTDSPWYPTARLYRQAKAGRWGPVLKRVQADLAERVRTG